MIECRGRNGWFNLHEARATVFSNMQASVSLVSAKPYRDMPPIYFSGPKADVLALLNELKAQVEDR